VADNTVEILVKSKNKTGEGFKAAEAEAEASGGRIASIFDKVTTSVNAKLGTIGAGIGKAAGLFAGGSGLLAMAGPIGAAGIAMGAFGAIAVPVIDKLTKAHTALAAAQLQYSKATTAAGRASALKAETAATAGLTDAQKGLMGQAAGLSQQFGKLVNQLTPVVVMVAALAVKLGTALMPVIQKLAPVGAQVIAGFLGPLVKLLNSPVGVQFFAAVAKFGAQAAGLIGPQVIKLLGALMVLFMQLMPAGIKILAVLLPLIVLMVANLTPVIVAVANLVAGMLTWLQANHLLIPALGLLGAALLAMGLAMDANPIGLLITGLLLLTVALVQAWRSSQTFRDIVTSVFAATAGAALGYAKLWLTVMKTIADTFLSAVGVIVHGAAMAFGWVPGVGPKLKSAAKAFDDFRAGVDNVFNAAKAKVGQWDTAVGNMPKEVRLKGEISDLQAKVDAARAKLRTVPASQRAAILGNINDLLNKIAQARAALRAINGASAMTYIYTVASTPGGNSAIASKHLATGGIAGAAGGGPRSRLTEVGEHGRELIDLPPGTRVHSNPDTEAMLGQGGGAGGGRTEIVLTFSEAGFRSFLKASIRNHGGDPLVIGN
jgi:hypothetical protein